MKKIALTANYELRHNKYCELIKNTKNKSDKIAIFRRLGILKSQTNISLKQGLLHTNTFAEGKLLVPREWSPGGGRSPRADGLFWSLGSRVGEHPALAAESDETFPWDSPVTKIQ